MTRRAFAISAVMFTACAPPKRRRAFERPDPYEEGPAADSEAAEMESRIREERRAEREKLGDMVTGDRQRLFRTYGFPDANSSGKDDLESVQQAEWWMYGKRFRRMPDGTGDFECKEYYYFSESKISESKSVGACK